MVKREIAKSRPESRPRPRHRRGFFLGFMFELRNRRKLSNFAQTRSRSRREDFSSVRDPARSLSRPIHTPPNCPPLKKAKLVWFPRFPGLIAAHVFSICELRGHPPQPPPPPSSPPPLPPRPHFPPHPLPPTFPPSSPHPPSSPYPHSSEQTD